MYEVTDVALQGHGRTVLTKIDQALLSWSIIKPCSHDRIYLAMKKYTYMDRETFILKLWKQTDKLNTIWGILCQFFWEIVMADSHHLKEAAYKVYYNSM